MMNEYEFDDESAASARFRLKEDFLEALATSGVVLKADRVEKWARRTGFGAKNGVIGKVLNGRPCYLPRICLLVRYLRSNASNLNPQLDYHGLLEPFVRRHAKVGLSEATIGTIALAISESCRDSFLHGPAALVEQLLHGPWPTGACRIADPLELAQAVDWMFVECGRQLASEPIEPQEASRLAQASIGRSVAEYVERLRRLHAEQPWVLTLCDTGRRLGGMNLCLPVTEDAFERVAAGRARPVDLEPRDLTLPSRWILIEACAMVPPRIRSGSVAPDMALVAAHVSHLAFISRVTPFGLADPVRFLTFEGTPVVRQRTEKFGYHRTGGTLEGSDIPLLEKVFPRPGFLDELLLVVWKKIARSMEERVLGSDPADPLTDS